MIFRRAAMSISCNVVETITNLCISTKPVNSTHLALPCSSTYIAYISKTKLGGEKNATQQIWTISLSSGLPDLARSLPRVEHSFWVSGTFMSEHFFLCTLLLQPRRESVFLICTGCQVTPCRHICPWFGETAQMWAPTSLMCEKQTSDMTFAICRPVGREWDRV